MDNETTAQAEATPSETSDPKAVPTTESSAATTPATTAATTPATTPSPASRRPRESKEKHHRKRGFGRRKVCRFCADKGAVIDYKDAQTLKFFITDRGKLIPRRISGNCAKHQRKVARHIKRARMIALMPFTVSGE